MSSDPTKPESQGAEIADDTKLLISQLGGGRGMFESGAPAILFVISYSVTDRNIEMSVLVALAVGLLLGIIRLLKRQPLTQVIAGLVGLIFSAWLATNSGKAENFFLPGILTNLFYAAACIISLLINRPLIGYVIEAIKGSGANWLSDRRLVRRYRSITVLWSAVFSIRVLVMGPLYLANETVLLGFFKVALGWPLFALAGYLTFAMSKSSTRT
jgi:hypothetical protein